MVRLLTLSGLILLLAAPTASAGVREQILRECQDGSITGNYTAKQLRDARKHIPTDIDEYSDCRDVLARAGLSSNSSGGGGGGGGSTTPGGGGVAGGGGTRTYASGPEETKDLEKALVDAPAGTTVDGDKLVPSASGLAADAARHTLPSSWVAALILLGLSALAMIAPTVRRRVIARRQS